MALKSSIETLNALPLSEYRKRFWPHSDALENTFKGVSTTYDIPLESSSTLQEDEFNACFNLVASSSATDYEKSSLGWLPAKKKKEMRLPELRYVLLKRRDQDEDSGCSPSLDGFISWMLTYEDGYEVIYCYEIHLSLHRQGQGLGRRLMEMMEQAGRRAGVEKAMLTVFTANKPAMRFYERLGYEEDDYSPRSRKLRGGIVKQPDYMILSKSLAKGKDGGREGKHPKKHKTR